MDFWVEVTVAVRKLSIKQSVISQSIDWVQVSLVSFRFWTQMRCVLSIVIAFYDGHDLDAPMHNDIPIELITNMPCRKMMWSGAKNNKQSGGTLFISTESIVN